LKRNEFFGPVTHKLVSSWEIERPENKQNKKADDKDRPKVGTWKGEKFVFFFAFPS